MQQCSACAHPANRPYTPSVVTADNSRTVASTRNAGIDLLRGLAILLVVLRHVDIRMPLRSSMLADVLPRPLLNALVHSGYEAVFIFFVISGFLITLNTLARWGSLSAIDWRAFYVRRAARILPCLLLLLLVLSLLHLAGLKDYAITRAGQSLPQALLAALGLYLNWYEGQTGYLPANWDVLWSLSVEEVFYLAFPLLCLTVRRERLLLALLLVLALLLPVLRAGTGGSDIWQQKAYWPGFAAISLGAAGALLAVRAGAQRPLFNRLLVAGGTVGLGSVLLFDAVLWPVLGHGSLLLLTGATLCLLLGFHWQAQGEAKPPWRIWGTGWLQLGGRFSYEVYLTHMFVVLPLVRGLRALDLTPGWNFVAHACAVGLAWLLGAAVARAISQPSERALRRRLSPAVGGRPASTQCA